MLYAGLVWSGPVLLRRDRRTSARSAMLFLFAVVWATDIVAYFGGRLIGGPKLAPAISPKKTWSGAVAGTFGARRRRRGCRAIGSRLRIAAGNLLAAIGLALLLSIVAQAGDLVRIRPSSVASASRISSRIIPGHGGLMDRLDGFLAAAAPRP